MRICGISFNSSNTALAIIDCSQDGTISLIDCPIKQLPLDDHEDCTCLHSFFKTVNALVRDFSIQSIAIRKCTYSGQYQSGAPAMKMEALFQVANVDTVLISPKTVASCFKSGKIAIPTILNKYQHEAFKVAVTFATQAASQEKWNLNG